MMNLDLLDGQKETDGNFKDGKKYGKFTLILKMH